MANGSPLPASHPTPSSMPLMPSQFPTLRQTHQGPTHSLLQPHGQHAPRESFETLTSVASSNQTRASPQLHSSARASTHSNPPKYYSNYSASSSSPHQQFRNFDFNRPSNRGRSPLRDVPDCLRAPDEALHRPWRVEADQLVEGPPDDEEGEMIPTQLDCSWGSVYGFPYGMAVPDSWQQRALAIAEAEEAEYQGQREAKRKARSSGRFFGATLRSVSMPWMRRGGR